jgi:uncharacterized membrane protein YhaH (DUF805 family)
MKNLLSVEGRMRRKHYWLIWLIVFVINMLCAFVFSSISNYENTATMLSLLSSIFLILQGIKRMHDTDHSGWYLLVPFYNLILAFTPGTWGSNRYGADPKQQEDPGSYAVKDVLDAGEVVSETQSTEDYRKGLIYMIIIMAVSYGQGVLIQLLPLSYSSEGNVLSYQNVRLVYQIIELAVYLYMLFNVRNGLAKTALLVFFILNVFYTMRYISDFFLQNSFQF